MLTYPEIILNNIKQIKIVSIILSLISGFIKPIMYNINDIIIKQKISNPVPIKALKIFWWIGALNTSEAICFQPNSSIIALSLIVISWLYLSKSFFTVLERIKKINKVSNKIKIFDIIRLPQWYRLLPLNEI